MSATNRHLHDRALELAATALDFRLSLADAVELEAHLGVCPGCARTAAALRADTAALGRPATLLPPRRVDDAVFRAAAGREVRSPAHLLVVMAATALLLAALLGLAAAGASLLRTWQPVVVVPSPSAPGIVVVNPTPSGAPAQDERTPSVSPSDPTPPTSVGDVFPVASGTVHTAAGPDGGLYVVVNGSPSGSVVDLLAASGITMAGWPLTLDGWSCDGPDGRFDPVVAGDGSVRLVCSSQGAPEGAARVRAFAFDPSGGVLPGWPVDLPENVWEQPRIVDDRLVVAAHQSSAQDPFAGAYWLVEVAADGTVRTGVPYEIANDATVWPVAIGPAGIAYRRAADEIAAFDTAGLRPGWPVTLGGTLSALGFDAAGRVVLAVAADAGTSRLVVVDRDGTIAHSSDLLPVVGVSEWSGAGPGGSPMAPLVAADGTAFLVGEADGRALVYRIDPSGAVAAGWPHRAATSWQWQGTCPPDTTGCGEWRATPAIGRDGIVYLPLAAPDAQIGGSLAAVGKDGVALAGWPVHLAGRGSEFRSVVIGSDGTAFALAVEPSAGGATSATLVAFLRDGSVRWRSTLVDPENAR